MSAATSLRVDEPPGARALDRVHVSERAGWQAQLELGFERRGAFTRLVTRRHRGPLVVQRAMYPEGPRACHAIVVHPPGGIAGGDIVELDVHASRDAHAVLTTPGAAKLYKGAGRVALQHVRLAAGAGACIEWLPQETIVFDAADASMSLDVDTHGESLVVAWDIVTLGREAMGEHFSHGRLRSRVCVRTDDRLTLWETGEVRGNEAWLDSPVGWCGCRSSGTFAAAGRTIDDALLEACRETLAPWPRCAVSRLAPRLIVARYLGATAADARDAFSALWVCLRPALAGVTAQRPRIWST